MEQTDPATKIRQHVVVKLVDENSVVEALHHQKKCAGENTQQTTCSAEQMRNMRGGLSSKAARKALVPVCQLKAETSSNCAQYLV